MFLNHTKNIDKEIRALEIELQAMERASSGLLEELGMSDKELQTFIDQEDPNVIKEALEKFGKTM